MPEKQDSIYYASGEDLEILNKLPNLQVFKKKNIEVLLLTDSLDEPCIQKMTDYEGKKFVSIQKSDIKLDETDDEKARYNKMTEYYKPLTSWWKERLNNSKALKSNNIRLDDVTISKRLTESPCVVVTGMFGYSAQQEKTMRSQSFSNKDQMSMMMGGKTLEINGDHPIIHDLLKKVKENAENESVVDIATTLFQTAMIESGYEMQDPTILANHIFRLMSQQLGVDPDAKVEEIELPEIEKEEEVVEEEESSNTENEEIVDEDDVETETSEETVNEEMCSAEGTCATEEEQVKDADDVVSEEELEEKSTEEEEQQTSCECSEEKRAEL
jgi:heat shock protein beta